MNGDRHFREINRGQLPAAVARTDAPGRAVLPRALSLGYGGKSFLKDPISHSGGGRYHLLEAPRTCTERTQREKRLNEGSPVTWSSLRQRRTHSCLLPGSPGERLGSASLPWALALSSCSAV